MFKLVYPSKNDPLRNTAPCTWGMKGGRWEVNSLSSSPPSSRSRLWREPAVAPWPTSPPPRPPEGCLCWAAWTPSCWPHCSGTAPGRGRTGPVEVQQQRRRRINVLLLKKVPQSRCDSARVKGHLIKTVERRSIIRWNYAKGTENIQQSYYKTNHRCLSSSA